METGRTSGLHINGRSAGKPGLQFKTQKHVKQITVAQELLAGAATALCLTFKKNYKMSSYMMITL